MESPADPSECLRQCHVPQSCGSNYDHGYPTNKNKLTGFENALPVLDPLNCYCKPKICPKHDISGQPTHTYLNPKTAKGNHFATHSVPDTIELMCKSGFMSRYPKISIA